MKASKVYPVLFCVFGFLSLLFFGLFSLFLGASIGHDFNQWGYRAYFDRWDVVIEPDIPCLSARNSWTQGDGNLILFEGCIEDVKVNGTALSHCKDNDCAYWNTIKH